MALKITTPLQRFDPSMSQLSLVEHEIITSGNFECSGSILRRFYCSLPVNTQGGAAPRERRPKAAALPRPVCFIPGRLWRAGSRGRCASQNNNRRIYPAYRRPATAQRPRAGRGEGPATKRRLIRAEFLARWRGPPGQEFRRNPILFLGLSSGLSWVFCLGLVLDN